MEQAQQLLLIADARGRNNQLVSGAHAVTALQPEARGGTALPDALLDDALLDDALLDDALLDDALLDDALLDDAPLIYTSGRARRVAPSR